MNRDFRWLGLLVFLALACLAFFLSPYLLGRLSLVLSVGITLTGLVLVLGYCGQINLAQGAFFAVGAYAFAILRSKYGWPMFPALGAGIVFAAMLGAVTGLPAVRLKHFYLALATIVVAVAIPPVLNRWTDLTGGASGLLIPGVSVPSWLPLDDPDRYLYLVCLTTAALVCAYLSKILKSPLAHEMTAVRENEVAAVTAGVAPAKVKIVSFIAAAALAGLGGGLFAQQIAFVSPETYSSALSVMFIAGSIVGGIRSLAGAFLGAIFLQFIPDVANEINPSLSPVLLGLGLLAAIRFFPEGPIAWIRQRRSRGLEKKKRTETAALATTKTA